jgi:hypothetical protein
MHLCCFMCLLLGGVIRDINDDGGVSDGPLITFFSLLEKIR